MTTTENMQIWDALGKTDPTHTKSFQRAGGFRGTAIKPMFSYKRMTEHFGPCGIGWGVSEPVFQIVNGAKDEMLVYCTASVWYRLNEREGRVYGIGGDKIATLTKNGLANDDEAFKKAYTDAVTNAMKMIGVGADVHMGLFDDSKYVNAMRDEFAEDQPANDAPAKKSAASLKRDGDWERLCADLDKDLLDCNSVVALGKLRSDYRQRAEGSGWPKAWLFQLKDKFDAAEADIARIQNEAADHPLNAA